jgi:uncharacterized phiE125 gp8 family phage protein
VTLINVIPPAEDVLTLAEVKAHLRVDDDDEDDLIAGLIATATAQLDGRDGLLGRALATQTWRLTLDAFPCEIGVPLPPLLAVDAITYLDADGAEQTLPEDQYQVIGLGGTDPVRIRPVYGQTWPSTRCQPEAVSVQFTAGYVDAEASPAELAVPDPIRTAMLLHVAHLYEHREAVASSGLAQLPMGYDALVSSYRVHAF